MKILCENEGRRLFFFHLLQGFFHDEASDFDLEAIVGENSVKVILERGGRREEGEVLLSAELHRERRRGETAALGSAFVQAASKFSSYRPPYGTLTGVRPVKVPLFYLDQGMNPSETVRLLTDEFSVAEKKARLLVSLAQKERSFRKMLDRQSAVLYVSIPFCPTRCSYCSFVSSAAEKHLKLIPLYLDRLCDELKETASILERFQIKLRAVYVGGGTPGILSAEELKQLLGCIRGFFDLSDCKELCVEIGRPDTITEEKLEELAQKGVNRISINPQTTSDRTLERIGRRHSADDFFRAMNLARRFPFAVNCDLISALPGETPEDFLKSVREVLEQKPENLTLHALCRKKSAKDRGEARSSVSFSDAVEKAHDLCIDRGLEPYYLYRQKMSADDLENLGFARDGHLGLYNLAMMEDLCDVFACGAGGIGKLIPWETKGRIHRFAGFKYPFEYLDQTEKNQERLLEIQREMERRSHGFFDFPQKRD